MFTSCTLNGFDTKTRLETWSAAAREHRLAEEAMADGVDDLSGISLEGVVVVFGSASLATLAFLATNSNSVLANGDLGLQQVIRAACGRARVVARDKIPSHACVNRVA